MIGAFQDSDVLTGRLEGWSDPPSVVCIPALERTREKIRTYELPGQGVPADGCGEATPYHCNHHDGGVWKRSHCNERGCPRCYERWASKEAGRAGLRVAWGTKYWQTIRPFKEALIGHFVVSMPSEQGLYVRGWSPAKFKKLVYEICQAHVVLGGVVIFHPWRKDDDLQEYVPDGYWHAHVIGLHFERTSEGGSDIGPDGRTIVFKHIRDEEYGNFGGIRSQEGIERVVRYQLTHAGLQDGAHALTYFGLLSPRDLPNRVVEGRYPSALEKDSKTNPEVPVLCPACGSPDLEPCSYDVFAGREGMLDIHAHPEPEYEPSPEVVDQAEAALEEKFQNLYDNEPAPAERHKLTKERQRERGKLAGRELEFFNIRNPLVEAWIWLRTLLEDGPVDRGTLDSDHPDLLRRVIELNLSTNRLALTPGGHLSLVHEYGLEDALRDVKDLVLSGEPIDGHDWRLERLIGANAPEGNILLTDYGFVFGGS